jgi:hypothetical protein
MWEFIILGQVPGTNLVLSYADVTLAATGLLLLVLARSIARRRSSMYWRVQAELMLHGVEEELFPYQSLLGDDFENPFIRDRLRVIRRSVTATTAGYFHRIVAVPQAGISSLRKVQLPRQAR